MDPIRDKQIVTPTGKLVYRPIEGVKVREMHTLMDYRGELTEIWNPDWDFHGGGVPFVYHVECAPGSIRAWVVHQKQSDRLYFSSGRMQIVLFDDRKDSSTKGVVNELYFGTSRKALLLIPPGVFHGVRNVGIDSAWFINMPDRPYNHENPDKLRLPLENDLIPFKFQALDKPFLNK